MLGEQFILDDPVNPLNIFAQITPDNPTPAQAAHVAQHYSPNGLQSAHTVGVPSPGVDIPGAQLPQQTHLPLSGSPFEFITLPQNQGGITHPVSIPQSVPGNPDHHSVGDSGIVTNSWQGSVTPDISSGASFQESLDSQPHPLDLLDDLSQDSPSVPLATGINQLTLEPVQFPRPPRVVYQPACLPAPGISPPLHWQPATRESRNPGSEQTS